MNAFFIDADNLNGQVAITEAFQALQELTGEIHVRRAYGSAEILQTLADTFRTHAIRPYPNLCLQKNTTDIALAADLMAMACGEIKLDLVAIGSNDMDFAPLVVRLRERTIKVVCITNAKHVSHDAEFVYDHVIQVGSNDCIEPEIEAPAKLKSVYHSDVIAILRAAPDLINHEWQPLCTIARVLRQEGLLDQNSSSVKMFQSFPGTFEVTSTKVRLFRKN